MFPSLLLITTLFRLGINISVTRLVLLRNVDGAVWEGVGTVYAQPADDPATVTGARLAGARGPRRRRVVRGGRVRVSSPIGELPFTVRAVPRTVPMLARALRRPLAATAAAVTVAWLLRRR